MRARETEDVRGSTPGLVRREARARDRGPDAGPDRHEGSVGDECRRSTPESLLRNCASEPQRTNKATKRNGETEKSMAQPCSLDRPPPSRPKPKRRETEEESVYSPRMSSKALLRAAGGGGTGEPVAEADEGEVERREGGR